MLVKLLDESWLVFIAHVLSEEVSVIGSTLPSEFVWHRFVIVRAEVAENSWGHVRVVGAWSHRWEHHGPSLHVALSCYEPAWHDDAHEISEKQEPSLFAGLDLQRVEMHVELGTDVGIENGVDVL